MDDLDFIEALSKESSIADKAKGQAQKAFKWAGHNKALLAALATGASLGGLGAYLASKPNKKTGKSLDQQAYSKIKKPKADEGKAEAFGRIRHNTAKEIADYGAKHPGHMALLGAGMGAGAGRTILKLVKGE